MSIHVHNCPFCGYHDVEIDEVGPGEIAVVCGDCQCIGPVAGDVAGAIKLWNFPSRLATYVQEAKNKNEDLAA